jgi:hypothetical protein
MTATIESGILGLEEKGGVPFSEKIHARYLEGGITMGDIEGTVALVIGIVIVFFVPALVWATVISGLYKIVREKIRERRPTPVEPAQEAQRSIGSS